MIALGSWNNAEISSSTLKSSAVSSSVFMELFLEPNVQELTTRKDLSPEAIQQLDNVLLDTPLGSRLISVKIWQPDGTVLYSTNRELVGQTFPSPDVRRAARGEVVAQYNQLDEFDGAFERATGLPLVEVYAPLREQGTERVIAVGEYYEHAPWFGEELARSRLSTWVMVGIVALLTLGVLFLIVMRGSSTIAGQKKELRQRMVQAENMAAQNHELRIAADAARLDASEANEQLLASIGSELHDGPIQLLSVVSLKLAVLRRSIARLNRATDPALDTVRMEEITSDALEDLRNLSVGLILPEIDRVSLRAALELAISRHREATGAEVAADVTNSDASVSHALKTCAYRVVQEGLSNSYKHGNATAVATVSAVAREGTLRIVIADNGPGIAPAKVVGGRQKLGLTSLRNRIGALKGTIRIDSVPGRGTTITAELPLDQPVASL
jgi:signal transduction histidine kinase